MELSPDDYLRAGIHVLLMLGLSVLLGAAVKLLWRHWYCGTRPSPPRGLDSWNHVLWQIDELRFRRYTVSGHKEEQLPASMCRAALTMLETIRDSLPSAWKDLYPLGATASYKDHLTVPMASSGVQPVRRMTLRVYRVGGTVMFTLTIITPGFPYVGLIGPADDFEDMFRELKKELQKYGERTDSTK